MNEILTSLGWGWLGIVLFMLVLWGIQLRTRNVAILDVGWASGLVGLALYEALRGTGDPIRRALLAAMVLFWGGRLALYLLSTRVLGGHPEDPRYTDMKKKWGNKAGVMLFLTFQFQGALDVLLSVPFAIVFRNPAPGLSNLEWAGLLVWAAAWAGESLADRQLEAFKRNAANKGKTCRAGLWNYSRHPNYFFEWLIWCAYALFESASPLGWIAWACPALMLYFLFKVTGIPLTEAQALKSRGEDYRRYQQTTSVFVPWFPRKEAV
jgi:steroid 5-alpha reductase family enzyme